MIRKYIDKWADEILEIAEANWDNLVLLKMLEAELRFRSSNAGIRARTQVSARVVELEKQQQFAFEWPSADAPGGDGSLSGDHFYYKDGLLSFIGYRVGKTNGVEEAERHHILHWVLFNKLPDVVSLEYMREWGLPKSAMRLQKMAESIASFTRNAKRRNEAGMSCAINEWENDLAYLKENYYHPRLGFAWPNTNI